MKAAAKEQTAVEAMAEDKQLVVPVSTAAEVPALPDDLRDFTGFESLDPSKFIVPRIKVGQLMSREGTAGRFRMNLTGDEYDQLDMIVIKAEPGRVMMDKDMTKDKPECRSFDGLVPDARVENPPNDQCVMKAVIKGKAAMVPVCPCAKWGNSGERPSCDETYNLLCLFTDDYLPFWLTLHGTAIKPLMGYISAIALRRSPLWQYRTSVTLLEVLGGKGKYYVPKFSRPEPISRDREAEIAEMVMGIKDIAIRTTMDAEDEVGGDAGDGTTGEPQTSMDMPSWMEK